MGDEFFAIFVLFDYHRYREKKLSLLPLILIFCLSMLFSTPAAFFIAGTLITEILSRIHKKRFQGFVVFLAGGFVVLAVFAANYIFWLKQTATDPIMVDFWNNNKIQLFPHSMEEIRHNLDLLLGLFTELGEWMTAFLVLFLVGFGWALAKRNTVTIAVGISLLLLIGASAAGKYPITPRLWLFIFVIVFMYAFLFLSEMRPRLNDDIQNRTEYAVKQIVVVIAAFVLLLAVSSLGTWVRADYKGYGNNMPNPLISYVEAHIEDGEFFIANYYSYLPIQYKNGYGSLRIGNTASDNIIYIYTLDYESRAESEQAVSIFEDAEHAYFMVYNNWPHYDYLLERLGENGYVDRIIQNHETPLYYYSNDLEGLKTNASIELLEQKSEGDQAVFRILVSNTGETIFESVNAGFVHISLAPNGRDPLDVGALPLLLPGECAEVSFSVDKALLADGAEINLYSAGRFDFSELGMRTISVPNNR
jgi:hypothetical protein